MRRNLPSFALIIAMLGTLPLASSTATPAEMPSVGVEPAASDVPELASFLENTGQIPRSDVRYYAASSGLSFGFARDAVLVNLAADGEGRGELVLIRFDGANAVEPEARGELAHRTTFFLGADPEGWRTGLRSYREIVYPDLYDGIDLVYRMEPRGAKYEFTVRPGADLSRVRLSYEGAGPLHLSPTGDLVMRTSLGDLRDTRPIASQDGAPVACRFTLSEGIAGVSCPERDPSRTLVIDPLVYATFLGGSDFEDGRSIAVDAAGNAYVTGATRSTNFPATVGAYNTTHTAMDDVFVAKLDPTGRSLLWATYIGGDGTDVALGIAISGGSAFVTGQTDSPNFPTTTGALDGENNATDAFVVKLGPAGDILTYSTFLGGDLADVGESIEVDAFGNAFVTGLTMSSDFPTTPGAMNTTYNGGFSDAFLVKLNPTGTGLVFGTYFGGSVAAGFNIDAAWDLAVDPGGSAFVCGVTNGIDFPTTPGAFNRTLNGPGDAFVARFLPDGSGLVYSTYLGGSGGESAASIAIDSTGSAFVAGQTDSPDFPVTAGALNGSYGGATDGFVARLTPAGDALAYATYLGSFREDIAGGIAVDANGRATVSGWTNSTDFPTTPNAANATFRGGVYDAYVARLDATGARLVYSTFVGGGRTDIAYGLALDGAGDAYLTGISNSTNFPTPGAYNTTYGGGLFDAFAAKVSLTVPLAFDTAPTGLQVQVDGVPRTTPYTVLCDPDATVTVNAPSPQLAFQTRWDFLSWSNGRPQSHSLACSAPVSVTATFVATEYQTTIATDPTNLFVLVDGSVRLAPHTFSCIAGSVHTIDTFTPQTAGSTRYTFASWSDGRPRLHGINCDAPTTYTASFTTEYEVNVTTAPANRQILVDGITLTAPQSFWWAAGSTHTLDVPSPQVAGTTRYAFASWSDGGAKQHTVGAGAPTTYTATFSVQYETTVTTLPIGLRIVVDGIPATSPVTVWCDAGSVHAIEAPSPQGAGPIRNVFLSWSDGGAASHSVLCDAGRTYTADFGTEYEVRLDTLPAGLGLQLDGIPVTAPHTFWCTADSSRGVSAPSPQVAGPTRYSFLAWSDGGGRAHAILCDQPATFTALFLTEHEIVIQTGPVDLDVTVDGTTARAPLGFWWAEGSGHTLSVSSPQYPGGPTGTRYAFRVWSDGQAANGRAITVSGPLTLTAEFNAEHPLTLASSTPGRSVLVDGVSYPFPQTLWWVDGTTHTLAVTTPQPGTAGVRYAFSGWSDGGPASRTITATAPLTLLAQFTTQYLLSLSSPYGTPWCDSAYSPDCWYDANAMAAFLVDSPVQGPPGVRYSFTFWSGDLNSPNPVVAIRMDGPKSETAEWDTEYFLQVVSLYGNTTGEDWYVAGSTATFSVAAREVSVGDARYRFVRWTGAVNSTAASGTVGMTGPKTVIAQWEQLAFYEHPAVWGLPILAVLLILVFLILRRRKKKAPTEPAKGGARPDPDGSVDRTAKDLSNLEDELDLDRGPER